jgi:hypothetical protein
MEEGVPVSSVARQAALERDFKLGEMAEAEVIKRLMDRELVPKDDAGNEIEFINIETGEVLEEEKFNILVQVFRDQNPLYTVPDFNIGAQGSIPAPRVTPPPDTITRPVVATSPSAFQDGGEVVVQNFQDGTPEGVRPLVIPPGTFDVGVDRSDPSARGNLPPASITNVPGVDIAKGVGAGSALMTRFVNPIYQVFSDLLGEGGVGPEFLKGPEYDQAVSILEKLETNFQMVGFELLEGRESEAIRQLIADAAIEPARFTQSSEYTETKLETNIRNFTGKIKELQRIAEDRAQTVPERGAARRNMVKLQGMLSEYYNLQDMFQQARGIGVTETSISDGPDRLARGRSFFTPNTPEE